MSVEKLTDGSNVTREQIPYTQICNNVITNIKNGDAFLVWAYLQSKSGNWKVIKQDIINNYGFCYKKIEKIFAYLNRANLIQYVQVRDSNGNFGPVDIRVLNGTKFDSNQQFIVNAPKKDSTVIGAPPKMGGAINGCTANVRLLNKEVTKERIKATKERKTKSFYENEKKHDFAESMNQMAREKKHIEEHEKMKRARIPQEFRDLLNFSNKSEQTSPKYRDFTQERQSNNSGIVAATPMAWGPGHPTWDSLNKWKQDNQRQK